MVIEVLPDTGDQGKLAINGFIIATGGMSSILLLKATLEDLASRHQVNVAEAHELDFEGKPRSELRLTFVIKKHR